MAKPASSYSVGIRNLLRDAPKLPSGHIHFLRLYECCEDAAKYARVAGISLSRTAPKSDAYVYFLLDEQSRRILYVGKGRNRRMFDHVKAVASGREPTSSLKKVRAIARMLADGRRPVEVVFRSGMTDADALSLEDAIVSWIGISRLMNAAYGDFNPFQLEYERLMAIRSKLIPFDEWLHLAPRTEADIALAIRMHEEFDCFAKQLQDKAYRDTITVTEGKVYGSFRRHQFEIRPPNKKGDR